MTVRELIALLQQYPPDMAVWARLDDSADEIGSAAIETPRWSAAPLLMLESK